MMRTPRVKTEYDSEYDILYIIVGEPVASEVTWVEEDVYIRKDMITHRVTGAIIEDFSKKDLGHLSKILPINMGKYLLNVCE